MQPRYTQEEANEILLRAVETQPLRQEVTREQLASIATEVGISEEALHTAEQRFLADRQVESDERLQFRAEQKETFFARLKFTAHLAVFFLVMTIVIAINSEDMDRGGGPWFLILGIPWLLALIFHGNYLRQSVGEAHEHAFRKWLEARRINQRVEGREWIPSGPRRPFR